jgi:hypothetical protein
MFEALLEMLDALVAISVSFDVIAAVFVEMLDVLARINYFKIFRMSFNWFLKLLKSSPLGAPG